MADVVTLRLPRERDFRAVAHLVLGGLATRHELTYDVLDDVQTALDELLERRDAADEVTVTLAVDDGVLRASVGPFSTDLADELRAEDEGFGVRRVLQTVVDAVEVQERDGGQWIELTKRLPGDDGA